jgi:hypothetical protein
MASRTRATTVCPVGLRKRGSGYIHAGATNSHRRVRRSSSNADTVYFLSFLDLTKGTGRG